MKPHFKIKCFSEFVLRTPYLSLSNYLKLIENYSLEKSIELYNNPEIKEAIYLASPELLKGLDNWSLENSTLSIAKKKAFEFTFLKYLARMSSRCTPFGLFAGCSVGNLDLETNIILNSAENHKRTTHFDMHYWVFMLQDVAKRKEVKDHLKYSPNSSIYEVGEFYRFVEYKYGVTKREYTISAFRKSDLLKKILFEAKSGITIDEMIIFLADDESEKEEAYKFISQLIVSQFLVSELDVVLTGDNEWNRIYSILKEIPCLNKEIKLFKSIRADFIKLDSGNFFYEDIYKKIKSSLDNYGTSYEEKYLFQSDLTISHLSNKLSTNVSQKVLKGIHFLNGIQTQSKISNLENFKKEFIKRYESREMPLNFVLDTEIGIGYLQNNDMNDTHEILENYLFNTKKFPEPSKKWSELDFILQNKLQNCTLNNEKVIELSEKDFPDFNVNFTNTPVTFSVIIELFDNERIALLSSGNISASKVLGRFCNGNNEIYKLTDKIVNVENAYYNNKILAEIVHIPESRTGNVLKRPVLRKHEISYLCRSGASQEDNLDLNDLFISIQNNKIILRSEKFNKEVLPCLSNAHNYLNNSLPVYHFLCDLERQDIEPISTFNWGVLSSYYNFFPRVTYDEMILSKAKWIIKKEEVDVFIKVNKSITLLKCFTQWRIKRNIPRFVNLVDSGNTLLFDFDSEICINLFLKSVKSYNDFTLEEFLFTEKSIVKDIVGDSFCNQIILSYYKERS